MHSNIIAMSQIDGMKNLPEAFFNLAHHIEE